MDDSRSLGYVQRVAEGPPLVAVTTGAGPQLFIANGLGYLVSAIRVGGITAMEPLQSGAGWEHDGVSPMPRPVWPRRLREVGSMSP